MMTYQSKNFNYKEYFDYEIVKLKLILKSNRQITNQVLNDFSNECKRLEKCFLLKKVECQINPNKIIAAMLIREIHLLMVEKAVPFNKIEKGIFEKTFFIL